MISTQAASQATSTGRADAARARERHRRGRRGPRRAGCEAQHPDAEALPGLVVEDAEKVLPRKMVRLGLDPGRRRSSPGT